MAYQISVTITGRDGNDTKLGDINVTVPLQLFVKMDKKPPSYYTIKHIEELLNTGISKSLDVFMLEIMERLNDN